MNLLILSDISCSSYGGNFIESLKLLEKHILSKGNNVLLVFPEDSKNDYWTRDFVSVPQFIDFSSFNNLNSLVHEYDADIIHTHFICDPFTLSKLHKAINKNVNYIHHAHNHIIPSNKWYGFAVNYIFKYLMNRYCENDYFICVSKDVEKSINNYGTHNTCVIYNAVSWNRLDIHNKQDFINKKDGSFNLLIFANHPYRKGLDFAIKALNDINDDNYRLYITSNNKEEIENFMQDLSVLDKDNDRITILPPRNDIGSYLSQTDVFLSPSREEGFTYSLIEAAYCKCAIVATKCPGQTEHNINGIYWVSDPNNSDEKIIVNELASQIKNACSNTGKLDFNQISKEVEENFNQSEWVNKVYSIYTKSQ